MFQDAVILNLLLFICAVLTDLDFVINLIGSDLAIKLQNYIFIMIMGSLTFLNIAVFHLTKKIFDHNSFYKIDSPPFLKLYDMEEEVYVKF